tara:strand:+ start:472 stop:726 length:255 start_codon:yes stop_codon:yes gene_type:complete
MKDKNLPNDYNSFSLEELTNKANKMIEELEKQNNLENSLEKYQNLLKLNNIIEKKFQKDVRDISKKTKENILEIISKKNGKRIK